MGTFALEIFNNEGNACTFYTVRWENAELSETDKFFVKFRNDVIHKNSLQELAKFLDIQIGEKKGALKEYFRFENAAYALPPAGAYLIEEISISYSHFPLRLYCLRISDSLVILFNGAEKTSNTAQSGKTSMVFEEANQFAKKILAAIYQKDIFIDANQRIFTDYNGNEEIYL